MEQENQVAADLRIMGVRIKHWIERLNGNRVSKCRGGRGLKRKGIRNVGGGNRGMKKRKGEGIVNKKVDWETEDK